MDSKNWTPEERLRAARVYADYLASTGKMAIMTEPPSEAFIDFACERLEKIMRGAQPPKEEAQP